MHSAPHRNNSDFQLRYFIAGSCHTADGAWSLLYEQKLDMTIKLNATKASLVRRKARALDLEDQRRNISSEQDKLRYEADLMEFNSSEGLIELAIAGAEKELATIQAIMDEIEPNRKYAHLPLLEATEAAQQDEWREELKSRVENFLLSTGTIPTDQLETMRRHPDFESHILPHMKKTMVALESCNKSSGSVSLLTGTKLLLEGGSNGQST